MEQQLFVYPAKSKRYIEPRVRLKKLKIKVEIKKMEKPLKQPDKTKDTKLK